MIFLTGSGLNRGISAMCFIDWYLKMNYYFNKLLLHELFLCLKTENAKNCKTESFIMLSDTARRC